ncbi:sensor histidine kinase [Goodfellowiella coeruleoviolacea]|uniref:Oxygen sensor histidine kinase NreB n=1 Tax=Goodfellowiella coeruleoviolacea TaxID=334858 RepID=A0AAE3KPN0_9PSEU|nr:sensor histidine kinase [Goodfellowiella coeruleoviolacea]MCP2170048.1 Signal transduction histidine kinase [Goodfellowiella coeruleoviolacea]
MATRDSASQGPRRVGRWDLAGRARTGLDGLEHLVGGLGTAVPALATLIVLAGVALSCLAGVGLVVAPLALRLLRVLADRERGRLSRWSGREIVSPEPVPAGLGAALRDSAVRRELCWVACHSVLGLLLGMIGLTLPIWAVQDATFPLWWHLVAEADAAPSIDLWTVRDVSGALAVGLLGVIWVAVAVTLTPAMARLQAWPGRRFLVPDPGTDLALRVAQLTATRAAALDAHATELRRIERSLHDGTQNRLVAVTVLLGVARRALARDPADAEAALDRAQDAAEQALAELRAVVRGILPPVLADRSLADALTALAAACPVPCRIDADTSERCAASVEATAYFVVAEALTNIARHSNARHASVVLRRQDDRLCLRVTDDGDGGADEHTGSGLAGIRRRVEAHDGAFALTSPPGGPTTLTVSLPCGL